MDLFPILSVKFMTFGPHAVGNVQGWVS